MGTSASNNGPVGPTPLLPPWYNPSPDEQPEDPSPDKTGEEQPVEKNPEPEKSSGWAPGKGALKRLANGTNGSSLKKAGRAYVKASGGARAASISARQGAITAAGFAAFLGGLAGGSLANALGDAGIQSLEGLDSDQMLNAICQALAPVGSTNDDAIARDAMIVTLDEMYVEILEAGKDLSSLESMTPDQISESVINYVSNYVFLKWMHELGQAIERAEITVKAAVKLEREIKDYVKLEVQMACERNQLAPFTLSLEKNKQIIDEIFYNAYDTIKS